jgi:hypothetical protein
MHASRYDNGISLALHNAAYRRSFFEVNEMHTKRFTRRVLAAAVALSGVALALPASADQLICTSATFNAVSSGGNIMVTCTTPTTNSTCSLTGNKAQIDPAGGSVTLTASCGTITSWTKDGAAISVSGTTFTDNYQSTTTGTSHTYQVTGSSGTSNTVTITQPAPGVVNPPPPPSGTVAQLCSAAGYNNVQTIEMAWGSGRYFTSKFGATGVAVFHFRTPGSTSPGNNGRLAGAENGGGPKLRHAVLSDTPCDFNHAFLPYNYADTTTVSIYYLVGGTSKSVPVLQPNTDYYLNVKNDPSQCTASACEMYMDFVPPAGL